MAQLRIVGLPGDALAAAAAFHGQWLPKVVLQLPVPLPQAGGVRGGPLDAGGDAASGRPPTLPACGRGEDLVVVFPPADHTHRGWRLAVVQTLARQFAQHRINAVASDDEAAIHAAIRYLNEADGVTGQYLTLDSAGAGEVIGLLL